MSLDFFLIAEDVDGNEHTVLDVNITHNLTDMANAAGIYDALWHPENIKATHAKDITVALTVGMVNLLASPWAYQEFSASNGWGTYDQFVTFVKEVLVACNKYPSARIRTST